jgi:hypothetical protein
LSAAYPHLRAPGAHVPDGLTIARFQRKQLNTEDAKIIMPDNGMVERFNRRLAEKLQCVPHNAAGHHKSFADHDARNRHVLSFVHDYNQTRLRCLDYRSSRRSSR